MKYSALSCFLMACLMSAPAFAQTPAAEIEDEVVAYGTKRTDPAMSAYLAGDYVTAEVEFKRNAFCALRAARNFRSGVEDARDSTIRADVGVDANIAGQASGSAGGGGASLPSTASVAPSATINSSDFQKNETTSARTCADRGFQLYMTGLSQIKLGKMAEAKESFKRATVIRESIYDAYFRLALLEYQDGNVDKAKKQFKKLRKLDRNCRKCEFEAEITQQVEYLKSLLGDA